MTMLTVTQSTFRGLNSVHDLPTPPSTSRPSPPPSMSHPHRGLPPPAAMGLPPQQHPPPALPPQQPGHQSRPSQSSIHSQSNLPPPPQHWQAGDEGMKTWLVAKSEEEKTRQEELRLEQRRLEHEMLRSSFGGGIPPPLIPFVFAGMGSGNFSIPPSMVEWAQSLASQQQQLLPSAIPQQSPDHPREPPPPHGAYSGSGNPSVYASHPASPSRSRGQTLPGPTARGPPGASGPGVQQAQGHSAYHAASQTQQGQQEGGIFFHHWQPPTAQASGSTNAPGTPSADAPRKRKAPGTQQAGPSTSEGRLASPPVFHHGNATASAPGGHTHKRQRSDIAWAQPTSRVTGENPARRRSFSPTNDYTTEPKRPAIKSESGVHSVSSLLSSGPPDREDAYLSTLRATTPKQLHDSSREERSRPSSGRYHEDEGEGRRRSPHTDPRNAGVLPGRG